MKIPSLIEAYGAVQTRLEPRLQDVLANPSFTQVAAVISEAQTAVGHAIDGVNARILHALNLPAGTDVKRLRRQIGDLDHEMRILRLQLSRFLEDRDNAH
ncbi:hypothetical protein [Smaragdicoccus niigatensis]|uniref:hypothetical protein n=1 Tax=Smaragdicoccus niigatensis TaxID=359359 RepID=UPI000379E181|nr:hypothetical protein [Smaragdicoccus niigatensis]